MVKRRYSYKNTNERKENTFTGEKQTPREYSNAFVIEDDPKGVISYGFGSVFRQTDHRILNENHHQRTKDIGMDEEDRDIN